MVNSLIHINTGIQADPAAFVDECDRLYADRIIKAADMICENMAKSPIVLLSGPSGSGKTTTSRKLEEELERRGVRTHAISMDNYFKTVIPDKMPRTADGGYDYESPDCLDMDLLNEHFDLLSRGQRIKIPYFMFARGKRSASRFTPMQLLDNEIAIFEGIHAFHPHIREENPNAFRLFVSVNSGILHEGNKKWFEIRWIRLVRRMVRDHLFRGSNAESTLQYWDTVLAGEKKYILPYRHLAHMELDSSFGYELPLLKQYAIPLFRALSGTAAYVEENVPEIVEKLQQFVDLDRKYLKNNALLCEFVGGGIYDF